MVRVIFSLAQISGDDLIFPVELTGDTATHVAVLPRIVADRLFGRSGAYLASHLTDASKAIANAVERAWRPERLRRAQHNGEWVTRLWLNVQDFL